ncbi:MAG: hypothetical protein EU539_01885 [Promethearchaeota archaeon]|nr:MAG: hypothetical protein EU539_01885 [Candidatus Lokiarchaeota archaeon]
MSLSETLSNVKFKEESKSLRKFLSVLILIILIIGYIVFIGYTSYVSASVGGIRIDLKDFEDTQPDNETIGIEGSVIVKNTHWYSSDITDIEIKMTLYGEDDLKLKTKTVKKDIIPRLKKSEIDLDFDFTEEDFDSLADFQDLNSTDELEIKFSVSLKYAYIYEIYFEITLETELD